MRRIPCVNGFTWIASMPSAVSPDYFVAKKGAGQVKGRAVWIDGRGVKKHPLLKRTAGKCAEPIFCQENFILFFFTNKKREMAHFALQFAQFLFVVLLTFFYFFCCCLILICNYFFNLIALETLGFFIENFVSKKSLTSILYSVCFFVLFLLTIRNYLTFF